MQANVLFLPHPAFILRNNWGLNNPTLAVLRRLRRWIDEPDYRERWPDRVEDWELPREQLHPTKDELVTWLRELPETSPEGIAVDIEAAGDHIRLIGIARWDEDYRPVTVLREGGAQYWHPHDLREIIEALDWALTRTPLLMQNGQAYDVPEMEATGFEVEASYLRGGDTLIMSRYAYPETPANLQFIGIVFGGLSAWKHMAKVGTDDEQEAK